MILSLVASSGAKEEDILVLDVVLKIAFEDLK